MGGAVGAAIGMAMLSMPYLHIKYTLLESDFAVSLPCKLRITTKIIDQTVGEDHLVVEQTIASNKPAEWVGVKFKNKHHNMHNFIRMTFFAQ